MPEQTLQIHFSRVLLCAAISLTGGPATALTLATEEFPPLNFTLEHGQHIVGSATDLLREILRRTEIQATFVMLPWRNAYRMAQENPDTCVFSTARTPEREKLFQWVGPLAIGQWAFYSTPQRSIVAQSLDDLRPYVVGSYQSDARAAFLKTNGFQVDEAHAEEQNLKKLAAGKIDLWLSTTNAGPWLAHKHGIPIKQVFTLFNSTSYAACHLKMPSLQIDRMNAALRNMYADGTVERLLKPYQVAMPPTP